MRFTKTYLSNLDKGFEYLGIYFVDNSLSIDMVRLSQKVNKLKEDTKKLYLKEAIEKLNEKVIGFKNYYAKLIEDDSQLNLLQQTLDDIVIDKIVEAKNKKKINSKPEIKAILKKLKSYIDIDNQHWIDALTTKAYTKISLNNPLNTAKKRVKNEKRNYLQHQIKASEIVVSEVGAFLGFSQSKIKVKLKGQVILEAPVNKIKRILLLNRQSSISTYLIYECAKRKIDIDFVNKSEPYAMLTYYQHISPDVHFEQLKLYFSLKSLVFAKEVIFSKTKNQINLLKYFNRRRKSDFLIQKIEKMKEIHKKIIKAKDKKTLMGLEGIISVHYWAGFGELLGIKGFTRTHQNSKDEINQALNYAYAILYSRVQSALIHEGLNLNYPILHSIQSNKPTLVYDMIEAFRQPIVDREILSILNKGQKTTQVNGLLSKKSIKLIVQHIETRLATPTQSRFGKSPLYNIIDFQVNHFKRAILDKKRYKSFVNKY